MEIAAKYQMPERISLTPEAAEVMKRYKWPGNIRQLKNVTEQMSILMRDSRIVTPEILSEYEVWPTIEEQGGLVRVGAASSDSHSYQSEREMLFQMINALHREVNELKQKIASGAAGSTVPMESHVPVSPVTPVSPAVTVVPATSPSVLSVVSPDQNRHSQSDATPYAEEYVEESLSIEDQEKRLIIKALEKNRGRRKKAADELHISERTLYRKIKEYGLEEI